LSWRIERKLYHNGVGPQEYEYYQQDSIDIRPVSELRP
jgi:hypothetical protein